MSNPDSGSPNFSDFVLPTYPGVASYNVNLYVNGVWQSQQSIVPGATISAPTDDTGIQYSAVDAGDQPVILPDGYIVGVAFASTGTFSGALTESLACFARGTLIAGPEGPVAVEELREGDCVVIQNGAVIPIVWVGKRHVNCLLSLRPEEVWPVRVRAHSFAYDQPCFDLFLSPDHAVFINDVFIPIKLLINGTSISQMPVSEITYHHIQLPHHHVILAEGLPCESYLDVDDRMSFSRREGATRLRSSPTRRPIDAALLWEVHAYAPIIVEGPKLSAVRAKLQERQSNPVHSELEIAS